MIVDILLMECIMQNITQFQHGLHLDVHSKLQNAQDKQVECSISCHQEYLVEAKYIVFCEALIQNDLQTIHKLYSYFEFNSIVTLAYPCIQTSYDVSLVISTYGNTQAMDMLMQGFGVQCVNQRVCLEFAALRGHFDMVKYLLDNARYEWSPMMMGNAIQSGNLKLVKYLFERRPEACLMDAIDRAACNGHLEIIKYLHVACNQGHTMRAVTRAINNFHWDVLKYLHEIGTFEWNIPQSTIFKLVKYGAIEAIQFICENRPETCMYKSLIENAAQLGNLKILKYGLENAKDEDIGFPIDDAARFGHLHIVQYLHSNIEGGFTSRAIKDAVHFGHLNVIRFLQDNQCGYVSQYKK